MKRSSGPSAKSRICRILDMKESAGRAGEDKGKMRNMERK